jgi:fibronectin type 3 domain-containing protein
MVGTTAGLSYTDHTVTAGFSYTYTVSAFDAAGNTSAQSAGLTVSVEDDAPPTTPSGLHAISVSFIAVTLAWDESSDNIGVNGYRIYRDGGFIGTSTGLTYTDNSVTGVLCTYTVSAFDNAGNESDLSTELEVRFDDKTPPAVPTGLQVTSASVNAVALSWKATTDNVGVVGYRLYRLGSYLATITGLSYTDNAVIVGSSYAYNISAFDAAGNESDLSRVVVVNTNDITPPSVPTGLVTTSVTSEAIALSWDLSTDDVGVAGYRVYRSGTLLQTVEQTTFTDSGISAEDSYIYAVSAMDGAGNESDQSVPLYIYPTSEHPQEISDLSIYPNPNDGIFVIDLGELSGRFNLQVIASTGAMVVNSTLNLNGFAISLNYNDLNMGFYYIRIFNTESFYQGKLIIVK